MSQLTQEDRLKFYGATCDTVGLNPLTRPFEWLTFQGKLILYANKGCAEQLRKIHGVNIEIVERRFEFGCLIVRVKATDKVGRVDEAIGAVPFNEKAAGDVNAIAMMKCETKAKRRVTLSICGLGLLDESERDLMPGASTVGNVVTETETAQDTAAMLNKGLTSGEKTTAIEAEIVPEPVKPAVKVETAPKVEPKPEPEPSPEADAEALFDEPAAPVEGQLTEAEKLARELETVFAENPNCVKYAIHRGWLVKGAGLETMSKGIATPILKHPKKFMAAVETWTKGGAK